MTIFLIWTGCTNTKDGFGYRVFHNTTAKYNGYFYAQESMKEAKKTLDKDYKEDYDKILPIFVYGDESTAQSIYPQMERVIEKTQLVIKRHNMEVKGRAKKKSKRPELNKWIDNNYLLLGQGYFYKKDYFKAGEFLKYVIRKYKDPEVLASANNWMAKIYLESEDWNQVIISLQKAENGNDNQEIQAETEQIYADYYIRKKDYRKAADHLTKAISFIKRKKNKARPTFILAQLNEKVGESQRAIDFYEQVVDFKPKYELEFYALIHQAMAFNSQGGNATEIKEKLNKMLRDDKNMEYRDQIYYALADLSIADRNVEAGIEYLHKSLDAYVDNDKQKAKTFVRLADMYFEAKNYEPAQKYYDSTMTKINDEYERYLEIKTRAESLTELIVNLKTIQDLSDDLLICQSDEEQKNKLLKERQKKLQAEMDEKLQKAQEALEAANEAAAASGSSGSFWAYNPLLKNKGKEYFVDYWGDRPLEDNWRRKYKNPTFNNSSDTDQAEATTQEEVKGDFYVPTIEELRAELPCDPKELHQASESIAKAYYDNGLIYKEKFDDFEPGIESWESLVDNLDASEYHEMAYYQLYRSYFNKEQGGYTSFGCTTCTSKYWADIIRKKYPGSEWEQLVDNPNYLEGQDQKRQEELEAYKSLYNLYSLGNYVAVIQGCGEIIENEPDNNFLCRHKLLRAQAIGHMDGQSGQRENYIQALREISTSCKDMEEGETAKSILEKLDGNVDDTKEEVKKDEPPKSTGEDSPFVSDPMIRHYFAIVVPVKSEPKVDFNGLKSTVNDYLKIHHKTEGRKVTSNLFGREYQILLVKTFKTGDKAQQFKNIFQANDNELKEINSAGYDMFIVSKNNYLTIFKKRNLKEYIEWQKSIYN